MRVVGVDVAEIDVEKTDGVMNQKKKSAPTVAATITTNNGVVIEFWRTRSRKQFRFLDGGDDDVLFPEKS